MADNLPARFAPEGARFKKSDWRPDGSSADRQKRTYLDRITDLEGQVRDLQADLESRRYEIENLELQLKFRDQSFSSLSDDYKKRAEDFNRFGHLSERLAVADDKVLGLTETLVLVEAQRDKYLKELTDLKRPRRDRWEWIKRFPVFRLIYRYNTEPDFRAMTYVFLVMGMIATSMYFVFVSYNSDPEKHCFRNGASFFRCGVIGGVVNPLRVSAAWLLGVNSDSSTGNEAASER